MNSGLRSYQVLWGNHKFLWLALETKGPGCICKTPARTGTKQKAFDPEQPMTRLKQEQGCWVDDVQRMGEPASPRVLVIMWLPRAVLSLSLSVSRIKRRAYILGMGQSLHRLDKHTSALDWALQEVTEVVQVLDRPPEGHPTIQLPGRFQPQQQGLQSREEDAVPPSAAVLVLSSLAALHEMM